MTLSTNDRLTPGTPTAYVYKEEMQVIVTGAVKLLLLVG